MQDLLPRLLTLYPALACMPRGQLDALLEDARLLELEAGAVVFEELQDCRAFPLVLSGSLKVIKRSAAGREIALYTVAPGDACVVSSACLLGKRPYNAIGLVQADCELLMVRAPDFERLLSLGAFRAAIFALFSKRVLDLMWLIEEVAFRRLDQRLARLLLSRGPLLAASHQALADELGTVREMVTRILQSFAAGDCVRLGRGSIEIIDRPALERLASG